MLNSEDSSEAVIVSAPQVVVLLSYMIQQLVLSRKARNVCLAQFNRTLVVVCLLINSADMSIKRLLFAERFGVCALWMGTNKRSDVYVEDVRSERAWRFECCF